MENAELFDYSVYILTSWGKNKMFDVDLVDKIKLCLSWSKFCLSCHKFFFMRLEKEFNHGRDPSMSFDQYTKNCCLERARYTHLV